MLLPDSASIYLALAGGKPIAILALTAWIFTRNTFGRAAARERGVRWGGSQKGRLLRIRPQHIELIDRLIFEGQEIVDITQAVGLDRSTIHRLFNRISEGHIVP